MADQPASIVPKRKVGAPLGNQNALKHGFYPIKAQVLARLNTDVKGEFLDEIDALRSLVDSMIAVFNQTENPTLEQCQTTLRGVSQSFDTMKGLYLMQKVLYNKQTTMEKILQELADIPPEED
jgi:hypothetical protein